MIQSMTGFGLATHESAKAKYTVEIKSLNSKFLELGLKLPKSFSEKELVLRNECTRLLERGKVSIIITVEYTDQVAKAANINKALLTAYYEQLKQVAETLGDKSENLLQVVLTLPEVVTYAEEQLEEADWEDLLKAFYAAVEHFQSFRKDEGETLKKDLSARTNVIVRLLGEVESNETSRIPLIRERIAHYLDEVVGKENIDKNRFEQELIYYIDKLDITEEKVRLRTHCNYFLEALEGKGNGKKLGFISQEMGREINTLGSKANDAEIQQIVVQMKEELEKIKEQLLNIL
ncbi:YicC/YloC family endoribonuclease [Olivibacter sitiensis]|uniref:YicC/YloC family endoribonuclease n=1 Tax=Olivibacter sitiensis TaxID=376470 RepID=UPI0009FBF07E|nr:YicC/YloC family endoribonuclease [Olivibacter sitiensis]